MTKKEDTNAWYSAFKSRDARFDGRLFVGVSSTGIYCRPVCRAKMPKAENCTFFHTAAEAEQAGYRPCLICRPETAPGRATTDATASLVQRATRLLEETCGMGQSLEELAGKLGVTDRHLRRAFTDEYNVTPVQYLQTCRLLLAKSLLTDTDLSIVDVAMTSGFGSLRRFNDLFKKHYRMPPSRFRKEAVKGASTLNEITLTLGYRPPYQWDQMLDSLNLRAIAGIEVVRDGEYLRTVSMPADDGQSVYGWLRVGNNPKKNALNVTVSSTLLSVLPQLLARVRYMFDLYCDPDTISDVLASMNTISPGLYTPGIRVPGCFDAFEMVTRAVLGQQITVKAAGTLAARMTETFGTAIDTGIEGLTYAFPTPATIAALDEPIGDQLGPLGVISSRAKTIRALAEAFIGGDINFGLNAQPEQEIEKLKKLPGIGNWTAQYIAMRAMGWPDAFLETDHGVKVALAPRTPKEILALAESWRPWRSYATVNLWNSLSA